MSIGHKLPWVDPSPPTTTTSLPASDPPTTTSSPLVSVSTVYETVTRGEEVAEMVQAPLFTLSEHGGYHGESGRTLACWIDTFDRNLIKKGEEEEKEDKDKNRSGVRDLWRVVWGWVKDVSGWVFAAVLFVLT
ncbi:hypothetical protein PG990_000073 [Apiospora arundinis]